MRRVFDSDGHICEPPLVWTEYTERTYREEVLQVRGGSLVSEGASWGVNPAFACIPGQFSNPDATWSDILPGSFAPSPAWRCSTRKASASRRSSRRSTC